MTELLGEMSFADITVRYVTGGRLSCARHEGVWGCGGIAILIRKLGIRCGQ